MRRAYFLIAIPGLLVGIAYVVLLYYLGVPIHAGPFVGAAAAFAAAVLIVRHFQKRKGRRRSS